MRALPFNQTSGSRVWSGGLALSSNSASNETGSGRPGLSRSRSLAGLCQIEDLPGVRHYSRWPVSLPLLCLPFGCRTSSSCNGKRIGLDGRVEAEARRRGGTDADGGGGASSQPKKTYLVLIQQQGSFQGPCPQSPMIEKLGEDIDGIRGGLWDLLVAPLTPSHRPLPAAAATAAVRWRQR